MTSEEIALVVNKALSEEFEIPLDRLIPEARIKDDLALDSLDMVDMVIVIENAFNFKLKNREELAGIRTLNDIYSMINKIYEENS